MPKCKYGDKCYRKNEEHLKEFHPDKMKKDADKEKEEEVTVPVPRTKKRKINEESDEIVQKKEAKVMKENEEEEEEEEVDVVKTDENEENENAEEVLYDEFETVEEVVETEISQPPSHSYPHRSPFSPQPLTIYSLWKKALLHDPQNFREAFSIHNGIRLVGFFDFLAGELQDATDDEIRIHSRFPTDLPEMQTIIVTNTGRYALWRDDPKQCESMVVYVKHGDEHFPKITMVGDKPIHALIHAAGEGADSMIDRLYPRSANRGVNIEKLKADAKTAVIKRGKAGIGRPLHTMKLLVPVNKDTDVGYRSLGEDLNKLKRTLTQAGEAADDIVRKKKMAELREIGTNVQLANDECDFGTGLEWGHDLFTANYPSLDAMAKRYLSMAYQLLDRSEFGAILDAQMVNGERRTEGVVVNK